jgi:hypothetical protein
MKKYKVLKRYPKAIMNSGRMVTLQPKSVVYLKYERQLDRLIMLGYIREIIESKKKPAPLPAEIKPQETKQLIKPQKPKAKYQQEEALEDKTGE